MPLDGIVSGQVLQLCFVDKNEKGLSPGETLVGDQVLGKFGHDGLALSMDGRFVAILSFQGDAE